MSKFLLQLLIVFSFILLGNGCQKKVKEPPAKEPYTTFKPYTRWWWFASIIKKEDVKADLEWVKQNGFGGVEVAWIYPLNRMKKDTIHYTPRQAWLSKEWSDVVIYTKHCADSLGLGCDFTYGTLWPFGDSHVPVWEATMRFGDDKWRQDIRVSWEYPVKGLVIDHLNRKAFEHYADRMNKALAGAYKGSVSSLFVDSWEVETQGLWTKDFDKKFKKKFGYDITPYMKNLYIPANADYLYDYMKLISELAIGEFYKPFIENAHSQGCFARAQCNGAPVDIITAYSLPDVPETEAMLFEPEYSRIVASSAVLGKHNVLSSETFTCLYGWPRNYRMKEQAADLKLVSDALFAHGVNQIIWHGMPFHPKGVDTVKFYATVHVGPKGKLTKEIPVFNQYMEKISKYMRNGTPYTDVAVYLPLEDAWRGGEMPKAQQFPWAWGLYEFRYLKCQENLKGYQPLWINQYFLDKADYLNGKMVVGNASFSALVLNVQYLDIEALKSILKLAKKGLPVLMEQTPVQPGKNKSPDFGKMLGELKALKNVSTDFAKIVSHPGIIEGKEIPDYWCRKDKDIYWFFFSNPKSQNLHLPIKYGQSLNSKKFNREVTFNINGKQIKYKLVFKPYQSILLTVNPLTGQVDEKDITYTPPTPIKDNIVVKPF